MKRIKLKVETFQKKPQEPANEWDQWDDKPGEEKPESLADYEPMLVDGGCDVLDIQTYMQVRDDRVAVVFKNGAVLSVVSSLVEFERKLAEVGV
jgi:hypothetical protein